MGRIKPIYCVQCDKPRMSTEFPRRRRANGRFVCVHCDPSKRGRRTDRHVEKGRKYECRSCSGEYTSDWFDTYQTHGISKIRMVCRRCTRDADFIAVHGVDAAEGQLISDILYDFDLARTMFGMPYPEAVRWLLRGYASGVTEDKLIDWGATENRRIIWEPDKEGGDDE